MTNFREGVRIVLAIVMITGCGISRAVDSAWGFEALMQSLGQHAVFRADFIELRSSMFLSRPVKLKGILEFDAQKEMRKFINSPFKEEFIINKSFIVVNRIRDSGPEEMVQTIQYSLAKYPFLSKAISGVSNIFAGDREILDELYHSELSGSRDAWSLHLEPKHEKLAEFISSITVRGSNGIIESVLTLEADGDESEMTLHNRQDG